jgi:hypothetical protein
MVQDTMPDNLQVAPIPAASIPYSVSIETDNEQAYVIMQKKIENLLDENHVHEMLSDICRNNGATKAKVTIQIFV